ncbi:MAG TPA: carboxymuconolactone decarboxylase family protein [Chitinophagaceae bacterium]|nr:carboxymuconolactone decarboxylase family protein [Chitinophagaceae bacterium]
MKPKKIFFIAILFIICFFNSLKAQQTTNTDQPLDKKQQSIVTISAFMAKGDLIQLQKALNDGLDAELTINEIKEVLVQLYAYTGFPRSLNALHTFIAVLKERKSKGINDKPGKEPSPLPTDKSRLQFGTEMQTKVVGQPVKGEVYEFAPAIDQFLKEHLFGAIFGRDNLDWKSRELATISALASFDGTENQLRSHLNVGKYNGLTENQLVQLSDLIEKNIGKTKANIIRKLLGKPLIPIAEPDLMIRISEIEIFPEYSKEYNAILKEEAAASVKIEPGVIAIFPMYQKENPTQVRIVEMYASKAAYESHLKTPHFLQYKTSTLKMVKSLKLADMESTDIETMPEMFKKLK